MTTLLLCTKYFWYFTFALPRYKGLNKAHGKGLLDSMSYNDLEDRHVKPRKDKNMCKCLEAALQHNTHTQVEVQFTEALQIKMQSLP